ncbi:NADH-quinone oxidoreductase subunit L [Tessaracoccus antarcticus]|uniref:NADH-quinone oxidoreductase subunit L n=1 Tax=Tessaracoccus antarcticus TaxID=2479848 RepID=A0A3M0FZX3_9ACTN|nr:NADH-quinone oxidoreductase subunit L [Tessaracoccus antarcticus]RMB58240.1 NADH-quinone oxidoreductase subunit L [Tessaracoccus antarcticus]
MHLLEIVPAVPASGLFSLAWLVIAIPLACAALLIVLGKRSDGWGHLLATVATIASFAIGLLLFVQMLSADEGSRAVSVPLYEWIATGSWSIEAGLLVDQLSILFVLLITGVGALIHIYSIGYMAHDANRRKFFAYLNLFVAAMLILVLADNYLVLFLGWEGVGLASYLLIGFWAHKPSAAAAGVKAFVVNRVGDLGMAMAIFTMLAMFGSSAFADVNAGAPQLSGTWATLLGIMLLVGACAKSAQVPLQSWLLDAMEGPTPVSALIHAATMVTAGVYLVVRSHAIYAMSDVATLAVAIVGTVTLLAGAWIGSSKDDIKKVLAGSTMSQIGYMMLAAGLGPVGAAFAIFHLITHGFFKANMFLGAGSVMHGMNDEVDMRNFGGLAKAMRITFLTFGAGYLAIIGFPFTAGFYSKDHIVEAAFESNTVLGVLALLGAGVTAYYMTRLMVMTFFGARRWKDDAHPHESPLTMTVPLIVLGVLSLVAGLFMNSWIQGWLAPATGGEVHETEVFSLALIPLLTLAVVIVGVAVGWFLHRGDIPRTAPVTKNPLVLAGRSDLYGDALNEYAVVRPVKGLVAGTEAFDHGVVDGLVMGSASMAGGLGSWLRRAQNGYVRTYGLTFVIGVVALAAVVVFGQLV